MERELITVPSHLNGDSVRRLARRCHAVRDSEAILELDFGRVRFAEPLGAAALAVLLKDMVASRKAAGLETKWRRAGVTTRRPQGCSYLAHVGFFQYVGIAHGNEPGEAPGSNTYLPLTCISRTELEKEKTPTEELPWTSINKQSYRLAELTGADDSNVELLSYCFREVIRNVFEHSSSPDCVVMAQNTGGR